MRWLAVLMDARFEILGIRVGLDSIIGLFPAVGDIAAGVVSVYIVWEARRIGVPDDITGKMMLNVLIDVLIGGIPVIGDLFDLAFKANLRNMAMIEEFIAAEYA